MKLPRKGDPSITPILQASQWLDIAVLLSDAELQRLFDDLGSPYYFLQGSLHLEGEFAFHKEQFLDHYRGYIIALKEGRIPDERGCYRHFNGLISKDITPFYLQQLPDGRCMLRTATPAIQLQYHQFAFSSHDNKIHSMNFGKETVSWGLYFSFPQLFKDPLTTQVVRSFEAEVVQDNSLLFKQLQRWLRSNTVPVSFLNGDKVLHTSLKIGKEWVQWVKENPSLLSFLLEATGLQLHLTAEKTPQEPSL